MKVNLKRLTLGSQFRNPNLCLVAFETDFRGVRSRNENRKLELGVWNHNVAFFKKEF